MGQEALKVAFVMSLLSIVTPTEGRPFDLNPGNLPFDLNPGNVPGSPNLLNIPGNTDLGEAIIMKVAKNKFENTLKDTKEKFRSGGMKTNPTNSLMLLTATLVIVQTKQHYTPFN